MVPVFVSSCENTDLRKMKFLVLALCVAVASAATVQRPWQRAVATPQVVGVRAVAVAKSVPEFVAAVPVVTRTSAVAGSDFTAQVLRSESDVKPDGFNYVYETANGISGEASGVLKQVGESAGVAHQGSYRYTSPEGVPVVITYVADENGYQPQSDLLPVAPPVPEAILRSLEYIATHAPKNVVA